MTSYTCEYCLWMYATSSREPVWLLYLPPGDSSFTFVLKGDALRWLQVILGFSFWQIGLIISDVISILSSHLVTPHLTSFYLTFVQNLESLRHVCRQHWQSETQLGAWQLQVWTQPEQQPEVILWGALRGPSGRHAPDPGAKDSPQSSPQRC